MPANDASAAELLLAVLDPGSFESWDTAMRVGAVDSEYAGQLTSASQRAGTDESIITGRGTVNGRPIAVAISEFRFLAGSVGRLAAGRLTAAIRRSTDEGLALLAAPASGGTRMQDGTPGFVDMISIVGAINEHKAAGLGYLVYLRNPTTGGTLASWGSLGHVTLAEPSALVGFLGPRVYESIHGTAFPLGVQQAENLVSHGVIDRVVPLTRLRGVLGGLLAVLQGSAAGSVWEHTIPDIAARVPVDAWESVLRTRRTDRPGVGELLQMAADNVLELNGTGAGERAHGLVLAMATIDGLGCVVVGQDRAVQERGRPLGPMDLRVARRGMRLAAELGLPLVSVIDTAGAELSTEAEQGALAGEIARSLADLIALEVPSVSVLLGQGCGGGALAMLPANRVIAAQHAWLSPLPLEGASVIVHRTTERAPEMARRLGIDSGALRDSGIVDVIVPEYPDAADEPVDFCRRMATVIRRELSQLQGSPGLSPLTRSNRYQLLIEDQLEERFGASPVAAHSSC